MKKLLLFLGSISIALAQTTVDLRTQAKSIDFTGANSTKVLKAAITLPATCVTTELFLLTSALPGSNIYVCTATNTWTVQTGTTLPSVIGNTGKILTTDGSVINWSAISGDISGNPLNIVVTGLQGRTLSNTAPTNGQALIWNGSTWLPQTLPSTVPSLTGNGNKILTTDGTSLSWANSGGDISGGLSSFLVTGLQGRSVANTAPTSGQILTWNSSLTRWEPQAPTGGALPSLGGNTGKVLTTDGSTVSWAFLAGDISGTLSSLQVTALQGKNVAPTSPTNNQVLTWNSTSNRWEPQASQGGSGGGASLPTQTGNTNKLLTTDGTNASWAGLGGDLAGSINGAVVQGLQGKSIATTLPSPGQVLTWNGSTTKWEPQNSGGIFNFTRISNSQLSFGANCQSSGACVAGFGNKSIPFTSGPWIETIVTPNTNDIAYHYIASSGQTTVGTSSTVITPTTGLAAVQGITGFPDDSIPLYTWVIFNGAWAATGTDARQVYHRDPVVGLSGIGVSYVNGIANVFLNSGANGFNDFISLSAFNPDPTGVSDSTSAVQNWINAGRVNRSGVYYGNTLTCPAGIYKITNTITVPQVWQEHIMGVGGQCTFQWSGPNNVPMFNFQALRDSTIESFYITAANPLLIAMQFENDGGLPDPGHNLIMNVTIEGNSTLITNAFRLSASGSNGDNNNDFWYFLNDRANNYSGSCLSIEGSQMHNIKLDHLQCYAYGRGKVGIGGDIYGTIGVKSNFEYTGGYMGANTVSDFWISGPFQVLPYVIRGLSGEGSSRLLIVDGTSPYNIPVIIDSVRWAPLGLNADGRVIIDYHPGPLVIRDSNFGDGQYNIQMKFDWNYQATSTGNAYTFSSIPQFEMTNTTISGPLADLATLFPNKPPTVARFVVQTGANTKNKVSITDQSRNAVMLGSSQFNGSPSTYNATFYDELLIVTDTSIGRTINLPSIAANALSPGHKLTVIDGSNAASSHNILIAPVANTANYVINTNSGSVSFVVGSNGQWYTESH